MAKINKHYLKSTLEKFFKAAYKADNLEWMSHNSCEVSDLVDAFTAPQPPPYAV